MCLVLIAYVKALQSNQLSLPHQDDCNTRIDISNVKQNIEQLQTPTMGVTINKKSTTTEPGFTPATVPSQTPAPSSPNPKMIAVWDPYYK